MPDEDSAVRRLWPGPDPQPLDDAQLLAAYPVPDGRPLLRVNFISSVDGAATLDGRSGTLGDAADRRVFHLLRVLCDAVLVGAGTIRVERYGPSLLPDRMRSLRRERGLPADPVLVIVSGRLDLDPTHPLFTEAARRPVIVTSEAMADGDGKRFEAVADVLGCGAARVDLAAAVEGLHRRGLAHLLCEGGPQLLGSLLAGDLMDELCLTVAPTMVGSGPGRIVAGDATPVRSLALAHVLAAADELLLRYTRG